ncbi:ribosome silencing factor [Parvularcula oceani]|uniref:ribosome silencing factor n=1 Tax=Parvularcula oceani TaxID=1247963 RepID=UPI0009DFA7D3|nr:ribosome silencing factor [Parvularcula oceani]
MNTTAEAVALLSWDCRRVRATLVEEQELIASLSSGADLRVVAPDHEGPAAPEASSAGRAPAPALPLVLNRLEEDQAEDVVHIDLTGKSDVADAMIVASGRSQRHVGAIADKILRDLKDGGHGTVSAEGMPACDWVLIDAGDVIVHLFRPEVRSFYNLERIWAPETFAPASAPQSTYAPATDAGTE